MLVTRRNVKRHGFLMLILAELVQGVRYLKPISRQKHVYVKRVITARLEIETLEERFRISDAVQGAGVSKNGSIETHWERRNSQPYFELGISTGCAVYRCPITGRHFLDNRRGCPHLVPYFDMLRHVARLKMLLVARR